MGRIIERPRSGCRLHGALQTIQEIDGVVPIIHSNPGCGIQKYLADSVSGNRSGYVKGFEVPSTNVIEKQVIFGGGSRLREEIKNTVKVIEGELYIAISGCESEMVGDDIAAMAIEAQDQGEPVIYYSAAGFRGDSHAGYEGIINTIIDQLPNITKLGTEKKQNTVNLFGILPTQDIYWRGNLDEIKHILNQFGIHANTLFGYSQDLSVWKEIPTANLNIVFSKWGVSIAENLKRRFETPYLKFENVPIGIDQTNNFLKAVVDELNIKGDTLKEYLHNEEKYFDYSLGNILDDYYEKGFQKSIALVGDESTVLGVGGFLKKQLGIIIEVVIITDNFEEESFEISKALKELTQDIFFANDSNEINNILEGSEIELILGSSLEDKAANHLGIENQVISYPAFNQINIQKSYAGYRGGVTLMEDYGAVIFRGNQKKDNQRIIKEF